MDQLFLLKLILAFISGAVVVTLTTVISERISTKYGGIFAAMPNTMVITTIFIAWTQNVQAAVEATTSAPIGIMGLFCFYITYFYSSMKWPKSYLKPIAMALIAWFIVAIIGSTIRLDWSFSAIGVALFSIPAFYILYRQKPNPQMRKERATIKELMIRGIFSGTVVAVGVIIAKYLSIYFGGTMAAFPAVLTSAFAILHYKYGSAYVREFLRTVPFGTLSLFVFAYSANQLFLVVGMVYGIIIALAFSIAFIAAMYELAKGKAFSGHIGKNQ
ncbi:MAG: DUF3147 family protein [Candidatus Micrarchaeota archaeon]